MCSAPPRQHNQQRRPVGDGFGNWWDHPAAAGSGQSMPFANIIEQP